jgi:hypothetical protein
MLTAIRVLVASQFKNMNEDDELIEDNQMTIITRFSCSNHPVVFKLMQ